ncbi:MAG TPA: nucleoside-diphosphate kinase [Syntrophomonadaceae bacterium]|nr:nucleoside-diphosphate kinase [Syntrophomonadaceae bacterium]
MERTFVMVKPDGVQRGLVGEIIKRFEQKGLKIVGLKMLRISKELASRHYGEHRDKPFFDGLIKYITSSPVVAMILEGKDCISLVRGMMGATDPKKAAPGTIRETFGIDIGRNVIHGSDSKSSAAREISLFFDDQELMCYELSVASWIYE